MEIKTKYNIGDKVWTMHDNKIVEITINNIDVRIFKEMTRITYMSDEDFKQYVSYANETKLLPISRSENEVFASKEELLKSL